MEFEFGGQYIEFVTTRSPTNNYFEALVLSKIGVLSPGYENS
jgi:hypothetical protein